MILNHITILKINRRPTKQQRLSYHYSPIHQSEDSNLEEKNGFVPLDKSSLPAYRTALFMSVK